MNTSMLRGRSLVVERCTSPGTRRLRGSLGKPKISLVVFAENQAGAEGGIDGDWIGRLFGDGTLVHNSGAPVLQDVPNGVAVYLRGRGVHAVRLADSKHVAFIVPGRRAVGAQIEASGLFYAYNAPSGSSRGRVVFVPWADLQKKLH